MLLSTTVLVPPLACFHRLTRLSHRVVPALLLAVRVRRGSRGGGGGAALQGSPEEHMNESLAEIRDCLAPSKAALSRSEPLLVGLSAVQSSNRGCARVG